MRLAWYTGISTGLAVTVVLSAFHQRANFYSATVYLSQSNFCLLVLVNFVYIIYGMFIFGLQRLCFGRLRPIEVEQLSDRAWIAITETCLAMTIFREEIGAWFLVMFTALVTGKVWGWIGDGRLEVLEQQPPANPRLFHTRLVVSLFMSTLYDVWILRYCINTVIQQARPNMMVMFLFEFAVLAACSIRTNCRYMLQIIESRIVTRQIQKRLEERRREVQHERDEIISQREAAAALGEVPSDGPLPDPNDVEEIDIEVPGWEAKGQYVLTLELIIDFIKLAIYVAFFNVLFMFYGLPIHILRDLYMTGSAFFRRLSALHKYRKAIQSMKRYPDATAGDLSREDTCIICRDVMHPWDPAGSPGAVEKSRPKKLPCGHILHFGCLKSWLERQQVCPTCRSPVTQNGQAEGQNGQNQNRAGRGAVAPQAPANGQPPDAQQPGLPPRDGANGRDDQAGPAAGGAGGVNHRRFNFGPFRLEFIRHDGRNPPGLDAILDGRQEVANGPPAATQSLAGQLRALTPEFDQVVQRELASLQSLHYMQQELQTAQLLVAELVRIRQLQQQYHQQQQQQDPLQAVLAPHGMATSLAGVSHGVLPMQQNRTPPPPAFPQMPQLPPFNSFPSYPYRISTPSVTRHNASPGATAIPAGSPDLPEGVVIPPGWSLLPLQRMDAPIAPTPSPHLTTTQAGSSADPSTSDGPLSADVESVEPTSGATSRQHNPLPVMAPNPVIPNWSGSASLFANQRRGLSPEPTDGPGAATSEETEASESAKGKQRAVTVEDAEDDEQR